MVASIQRTPRPRAGLLAPLPIRWQAAIDELGKVAPSVSHGAMMSEIGLDDLNDLIAKFRASRETATAPSRWMVEALKELSAEESGYDSEWMRLRDGQRELALLANRWDHKLLGWPDDGDLFLIPGRIAMAPGSHDIYVNEEQVKARTEEVKQLRVRMQSRLRRISDIMYYQNSLPPPDQEIKSRMRDEALFKRVLALEEKLNAKPKTRKAA